MAFIFSTSHLPETLARRPDHLEEEEDDDTLQQPPPRAGGVRAFSHLPVRDNPALSTGPLREDSPRREIAPIPPRSATPSTSRPPMSEAQDDAPPPEADSDHSPEDDTAPQDHADDSPWYMPRITAQDLPPQDPPENAHAPAPKPWENTTRSSGFDDAPPADRSTRSSGFSPTPQDLRDTFHSPRPDNPTGEAPAQNISPAMLRGRIFEKRLPPGFRAQGTGELPGLADKLEYHDLVYRPGSAENGQHQAGGFFQNVADTRTSREAPARPQAPQTFAQSVQPAAQPAQKSGQSTAASPPPAPGNDKDTPPTFKVDPADESRMDFKLKDPVAPREYLTDRTFGDRVRPILQEELDKSPTARNLLEQIIGKSGKPVIIKLTNKPEAYPELARDGTLTVYINPTNVRIGTLTHEITHLLQTLALIKALASKEIKEIKDPNKRSDAVQQEISKILNGHLPVSYPEERTGKNSDSHDYMENEAIRAANIAKAEISAARVKEKLDAMNETERVGYQNNHAEIAALFWTEQGLHEVPGHDGNINTTLEIDQRYGESDFEHVLKILGITGKELMDACPYKEARDKAPAKRAEKSQASGKAGGR